MRPQSADEIREHDLPAFFGPLITGEQRRPARLEFFVFFLGSASRLRRRAPTFIQIGNLLRFEFSRRQVPETRVRSHLVVVPAPLLDADPRIDAIPKPLQRQMLVPESCR